MSKPETTLRADDFDVEYYASAEELISAACYMANKKLGREQRNHWIDRFNCLLEMHEKKFPRKSP